ncbi:hypothetical protein [Sphaerochaeta sp. PS]|uniref:hypothetical protein n=1 Tax=Sphaerochaeta sp. PS TaxID=3076336 RepID=UPI0028A56388|nr:hypothetical protein [Sphaerochaeta sp. PS]MDT4762859.1 hypothetical protein [Sphaerochaeta sp. PS]
MVETYGLPIFCLLLNFLAFAACLRFLFSRQGLYWVIPLIVTVFLLGPNALRLYDIASLGIAKVGRYTYMDFQPLLLSLFWYAMIVTFHFALKKTVKVNYHHEQVRKNLHEARYQLKTERITYERKQHRRKAYYANAPARVPLLQAYNSEWTDLFDRT